MGNTDPIKVLVVDGTAFYRKVVSEAVVKTPGLILSGTAPTGKIAIRSLHIEDVGLVLLDAGLPDTDALETLRQIRSEFPGVDVVMVSGNNADQARVTVRALASGAVDLVPKPEQGSLSAGVDKLERGLAEIAQLMGQHSDRRPGPAGRGPALSDGGAVRRGPEPDRKRGRFRVVLIGVSAGGPRALEQVLPGLPAGFRAPVLVVQHMPPQFTRSLAEYLHERSAIDVKEAQDGDIIADGLVLIAPGGRHMTVEPHAEHDFRIRIDDGPPVNSCRPSMDVLCESVARYVQGQVLAVILTGMGDDGARGVAALKVKGCRCIAQTERTCAVYGMPRAVMERGLADETVDLEHVAERIVELAGSAK